MVWTEWAGAATVVTIVGGWAGVCWKKFLHNQDVIDREVPALQQSLAAREKELADLREDYVRLDERVKTYIEQGREGGRRRCDPARPP